jgi:subtilisin family serine protease
VGKHRWWDGTGIVTRGLVVDGTPIGLVDPATDPEVTGVIDDPLEGVLDSDSGHGTFIAGLIHQRCPDADILSVRVMPSDGAVPEHVVLDVLTALATRQHAAQQAGDPSGIIDVLSMSLGYYHELPADPSFDPLLLAPLTALSQMGVAVAASAGNEATYRPMYPAAFAPHAGGEVPAFDAGCVPLVSVGALNPDGSIALFSNAGAWVSCHRPGASLVSTFPDTFDAGAQSTYRVATPAGLRASIDPDDFHAGFGVWSGTSFAAPILAGELAQALVDDLSGSSTDAIAAVARGWGAVTACTGVARP